MTIRFDYTDERAGFLMLLLRLDMAWALAAGLLLAPALYVVSPAMAAMADGRSSAGQGIALGFGVFSLCRACCCHCASRSGGGWLLAVLVLSVPVWLALLVALLAVLLASGFSLASLAGALCVSLLLFGPCLLLLPAAWRIARRSD
ncbi:hypothetical protein [Chitinilyticum litopenaei]|uniref:hypothetical protein n=1 Tax=Chitinilyticum litopenaei TaxID=1121276 RepID=UPI0003F8F21C|nr:hypothetical protein [Chitinilyticum litopenaei]